MRQKPLFAEDLAKNLDFQTLFFHFFKNGCPPVQRFGNLLVFTNQNNKKTTNFIGNQTMTSKITVAIASLLFVALINLNVNAVVELNPVRVCPVEPSDAGEFQLGFNQLMPPTDDIFDIVRPMSNVVESDSLLPNQRIHRGLLEMNA